ncbi:MAG: formimidoylglutamate deiminase, partial [Proteobacteria bacterium]|nr:formimidoylglutamate deiminase [Pseudomonadota bacterium]
MKDVIANSFWARNALLSDGWAGNVLIHTDSQGTIVRIESNQQAKKESEMLTGTLLPGINNLHSHAHQRAMAGLAEKSAPGQNGKDSFWTWRKAMYHYLEKIG